MSIGSGVPREPEVRGADDTGHGLAPRHRAFGRASPEVTRGDLFPSPVVQREHILLPRII